MNARAGDRKSFTYYMRVLHRDIGFLVVGLTVVYALSGIVLVYRNTDFMKSVTHVEMTVAPHLLPEDLGRQLHLRHLDVTSVVGDEIRFKDGRNVPQGTYNAATGALSYDAMQLPAVLQAFNRLHMINSSKGAHVIAVFYGAMLLFLGISGLAMFKPKSSQFRRGLLLSGLGIVLTIAILFFL